MNSDLIEKVKKLNKDKKAKYLIDTDGLSLVVVGNFDLSDLQLPELPVRLSVVTGNFDCSGNLLTSLEGCPKAIGKNFYCNRNLLIDLKGRPELVGGRFSCSNNKLDKSLRTKLANLKKEKKVWDEIYGQLNVEEDPKLKKTNDILGVFE